MIVASRTWTARTPASVSPISRDWDEESHDRSVVEEGGENKREDHEAEQPHPKPKPSLQSEHVLRCLVFRSISMGAPKRVARVGVGMSERGRGKGEMRVAVVCLGPFQCDASWNLFLQIRHGMRRFRQICPINHGCAPELHIVADRRVKNKASKSTRDKNGIAEHTEGSRDQRTWGMSALGLDRECTQRASILPAALNQPQG